MIDQIMSGSFAAAVLLVVVVFVFRHGLSNGTASASPIVLFLLLDLTSSWIALSPWGGIEGASVNTLVIAACGSLSIIAGFVVAGRLLGERTVPFRATVTKADPGNASLDIALVGIVLMGIVTVLESGIPSPTAILSGLIDPVDNSDVLADVRETRRSISKGHVFGGNYRGQGVIRALGEVGWRYTLAFSWLLFLNQRSRRALVQAVVGSSIAVLLLAGAGVRANLIFLFVVAAIAYAIVIDVPPRRVAAIGSAIFLVLVFIGPLSKGPNGFESFEERVASSATRIVGGNGRNTVGLIELIDEGRFPEGRGSVIVERLEAAVPGVPGTNPPFANRLALALGANANATTYATPTQVGLFYADFRVAGVIAGSFVIGLALFAIQMKLSSMLSSARSESDVAFVATAAFMCGHLVITGPTGFIANGLLLVALHFMVRLFERQLRVATPTIDSGSPVHV